jgi:hypothetical protein
MDEWHGWKLHASACTLTYPAYRSSGYPVDPLRTCRSSAEMLDTIMQVQGKSWASDQCIAGLVCALNDIVRPQQHLCSFGKDKKLNESEIRRLVQAQAVVGASMTMINPMTPKRAAILTVLQQAGKPMRTVDVAVATGMKYGSVRMALRRMLMDGQAERVGRGRWRPAGTAHSA